jgi:beta-xylosidase
MLRNVRVTWSLFIVVFLSAHSGCKGLSSESNIIRPAKSLSATTPWDLVALSEPPEVEWSDRESPVWSLYYKGEIYTGKPTRVFAYYASPSTLDSEKAEGERFPAVVLVHGGGGTAFKEWAELWAKRGYAAIAMDLAGCGPGRERLEDGGPGQSDQEKFGAIGEPPENQWTYHAVANVILAHSLIRSFQEVDASRTAVTGISWGGYLTCIVAGLDSRFKAAVPVYGCGFLHENSVWLDRFAKMKPEQKDKWVRLWDPSMYVGSAVMPVFFVNGTNDFAYPLDSYSKTYGLVSSKRNFRITVNMPHSHEHGWAPKEIGLFVDQYVNKGVPLPIVSNPKLTGGQVRAKVESKTAITSASLHYTTGTTPINKLNWETAPARVEGTQILAPAPPDAATVWFLAVGDVRGAVVSSPLVFVTPVDGNTGSWGDQADGTYRNPVLNADYPDSDVVEHNGTYYMISSKNHMSPGMVILESKDLVNWSILGHVWGRLSWDPKYNWDRMDGYKFGVWAGDLAYHDGRWYCYQIDTTNGLYMSSAPDLRGPWTQPHLMLKKTRWTDPAVYWDDDARRAYLVCNFGRFDDGRDHEIRLFQMSWDGRELLDEGEVIHRGLAAEAAKIYHIEGRWYIFLAQWFRPDPRRPSAEASSGDRKQLVLRSKGNNIYGPYEQKVVMERGNGVIRSACQGALLQVQDGSWWYIHQLVQNCANPFQGRPQFLEPVTWVDGWPIIGKDVDGDGIGEPVWREKKPIAGYPITAPQTDDEFDSDKLGPQWEWNHNPRNELWSLTERPGWLRLKASVPVGKGDFWGACNTISQRIMGTGEGTIVTKLDLSGMRPGQQAGFVRFSNVYHLFGVQMNNDGDKQLLFNANGKVTDGPVIEANALWIRTINQGDQARFAYSTDGESFSRFGPEFTITFGNWCGDRLGFYCWNDNLDAGCVDVDYFHYDYDGPKGQ